MKIHYLVSILFLTNTFLSFAQFDDPYIVAHTNSYYINYTNSADLDGDGDNDLIICNQIGNVSWRENVGNAIFTAPQPISTNLTDSDRGIGRDLDGDGDLDVLVSCKNGDKVVWFQNQGNGNFGTEQIISTIEDGVFEVITLDFDNDGDLDIASSSPNDAKITVFENEGSGQFSSGILLPSNLILPRGICATDIDNNGYQDIIAATVNNKVVWFPNLGNGTFDSQVLITDTLTSAYTIAAGDIDGDGLIDVVSSSYIENTLVWFQNMGGGILSPETLIFLGPQGIDHLFVEDFENDGDLDIIAGSYDDSTVFWFENGGNGLFGSPQIIFQTNASLNSFCIDNFNNDGLKDVCVTGQTFLGREPIVTLNQGDGTFNIPEPLSNATDGVTSVFAADLTGDGLKEILATSNRDDKVVWYKNLGLGRWGKKNIINSIIDNPQSVSAADLDGDNDIDIVSGSRDGNVYWYENFGSDSIGPPNLLTSNADWLMNVHTVDIDGDLDEDIFFSPGDHDIIGWFENLGSGNFGPEQTAVAINAPSYVWTADIDGDLDLDLICSVGGSVDAVNWAENLGGGNFGPLQVVSAVVNFLKVTKAADFDGDGDQDLVTVSALDDKVAWYENLGGGTFGTQITLSLEANYSRSMDIGDIDGDGDPDIVVASDYNENAFWIENLGNGNFSSEHIIGENIDGCYSVVVDDADGDGDQDVVVGAMGSVTTDKGDGVFVFANQDLNPLQARGKVYFDANQNGSFEPLEQGLGFLPIVVNPNLTFAYTFSNGDFFVNFPSEMDTTFVLQPDLLTNWMITSDSLTYAITVDSSFTYIDSLFFGVYPTTLIDSVESEIVTGFPSCNSTINFTIILNNYGTTLPSGILKLEIADSLTYVSSTFTPDSIIGQTLYWHFDSIFYFSNNLFGIEVSTGSFASAGIPFESLLTTVVLDNYNNTTFIDSTSTITTIVCAYDPNDKISDPAGIDSLGFIDPSTEFIDYTIRFQNTGTDTATIVRIEDQLDPHLDWQSINILAFSHDVEMEYFLDGQIEFTFDNIFLPDSSSNFLGSQGFVKYRIYIDTNTTVGTSIYNTAKIYFDYNPAVITNTKILTLYDCLNSFDGLNETIVLCEGDVLSISDQASTTQFNWDISGVNSGINNEINWVADTSGIFELSITKTNEFCNFDSTFILDVKMISPVQVLNPIAICSGESVSIFNQLQSISGIYTDTLSDIWGCDSIFTQELLVQPTIPLINLGELQICTGDSALIFGNYTQISGIYFDSLLSVNGCDSIHMQTLFVQPQFGINNLPDITICEGDSIQIFDIYVQNPGVYVDSLQTIIGCDSIVQQQLFIISAPLEQDLGIISICYGDSTFIFDEYYSIAGIYYDTLQGIYGCDSIQRIEIISHQEVNVSFGTSLNDTICINSLPITLSQGSPSGGMYSGNGVINDVFDPIIAGVGSHILSYIYTDTNNCDHVDQEQIIVDVCAGIENTDWSFLQVFPNPANDEIFINVGNNEYLFGSVEILDIIGVKVIEFDEIKSSIFSISTRELSEGTYVVKFCSETTQFRAKFIVTH